MEAITEFRNDFRWASNFWLCPVIMGEYVYPTVENAYQAAKFPREERFKFVTCSPSMAKKWGQDESHILPDNWEDIKLETMNRLLKQKFRFGTFNATLLLATGDCEIIEGNTWDDIFWGVCDGIGENNLGKLLMKIRATLIR